MEYEPSATSQRFGMERTDGEHAGAMRRIFPLAGTVGWGIAVPGVLLPWNLMDRILRNMGPAGAITDP